MTSYHTLLLPHCMSPSEVVPVIQTKDDTSLSRLTLFSSILLTKEQDLAASRVLRLSIW